MKSFSVAMREYISSGKKPPDAMRATWKEVHAGKVSPPPRRTVKRNPKSYPNIDPSGFRKGQYVGYADGVWEIKRTNSTYGNWIARKRDDPKEPPIYAFKLEEMSKKLSELATTGKIKRSRIDLKSNPKYKKNSIEKTVYLVAGTSLDPRKKAFGYWTGRASLTTELAEATQYADKISAEKTRAHLNNEISWIRWEVKPVNFYYGAKK